MTYAAERTSRRVAAPPRRRDTAKGVLAPNPTWLPCSAVWIGPVGSTHGGASGCVQYRTARPRAKGVTLELPCRLPGSYPGARAPKKDDGRRKPSATSAYTSIKTPTSGVVTASVKVGDVVKKNDQVATVVPNVVLTSPLEDSGTVHKLLHIDGTKLVAGQGILVVKMSSGTVSCCPSTRSVQMLTRFLAYA